MWRNQKELPTRSMFELGARLAMTILMIDREVNELLADEWEQKKFMMENGIPVR